jgi:predicted dehydrogenase
VIKAAIVGLGNHGLRHLTAIKMNKNIEVVAVCDKNEKNFDSISNQLENVKFYDKVEELFKSEKLDLISIVTNGPSHATIIKSAISAGVKYIFCEKPMCNSMYEAKEIIKHSKMAKARLIIGYIRRFSDDYANLIKLINSGAIGRPRHYHITVGSGLFAAVGIHYLDLFRMLSQSDPISVYGKLGSSDIVNPRGDEFEDPGAFAVYFLNDGSRCVIDIMDDLGVPPKFEIIGSLGRIIMHGDEENGAYWSLYQRNEALKKESLRRYDINLEESKIERNKLNIIELLTKGYSLLLSNKKITSDQYDGAKGVEMILAAHISSKEDRIITLPLDKKYNDFFVPFT